MLYEGDQQEKINQDIKINKVSKHGAYGPQKPQGLLGTGRRGGRGYGGGGGGGGGRGRGDYITYRYTVTTRMTSSLRWAAMTAILMFHNCKGQIHKTVSTDHNF